MVEPVFNDIIPRTRAQRVSILNCLFNVVIFLRDRLKNQQMNVKAKKCCLNRLLRMYLGCHER